MNPISSFLLAAGLAVFALVANGGQARADDPQIYLSWHAPWGQPGATDTLSAPCDSSRSDTLWLSFDPGKQSPTFLGTNGTLIFHPRLGATLSPWWQRDLNKPAPPQINVVFPPRPDIKYRQPFKSPGGGGTMWDTLKAQTRLRYIYVIPYPVAAPLGRGIYALARVIIQRPPPSAPACAEPLCIEWTEAEITFDVGADRAFVRGGPHRFVTLNSPDGEVAIPYRESARRRWLPNPQ